MNNMYCELGRTTTQPPIFFLTPKTAQKFVLRHCDIDAPYTQQEETSNGAADDKNNPERNPSPCAYTNCPAKPTVKTKAMNTQFLEDELYRGLESIVRRPRADACAIDEHPNDGSQSSSTKNAPTGKDAAPTGKNVAPTGKYAAPTGKDGAPTGKYAAQTGNGGAPTGEDEASNNTVDDALLPNYVLKMRKRHDEMQEMELRNRWRMLQIQTPAHDIAFLKRKMAEASIKHQVDVFYDHEGRYVRERSGLYKTTYSPEVLKAELDRYDGSGLQANKIFAATRESHLGASDNHTELNSRMAAVTRYARTFGVPQTKDHPSYTDVLHPYQKARQLQKDHLEPSLHYLEDDIRTFEKDIITKDSEYAKAYNTVKYLQDHPPVSVIARRDPRMVVSTENRKISNLALKCEMCECPPVVGGSGSTRSKIDDEIDCKLALKCENRDMTFYDLSHCMAQIMQTSRRCDKQQNRANYLTTTTMLPNIPKTSWPFKPKTEFAPPQRPDAFVTRIPTTWFRGAVKIV